MHLKLQLKNVDKPLKDRIFFVFKHYPLDSSCNPSVSYRVHPQACHLAQLAYCANKKGKFWEFHDHVFFRSFSKDDTVAKLGDIKRSLRRIFTEEEFSKCLKNKASLKNVAKDIKLGDRLGIKGTPAVYINGKEITIPLILQA